MNCRTVFSCTRRMFGEYVAAILFENMVKEIIRLLYMSYFGLLNPGRINAYENTKVV